MNIDDLYDFLDMLQALYTLYPIFTIWMVWMSIVLCIFFIGRYIIDSPKFNLKSLLITSLIFYIISYNAGQGEREKYLRYMNHLQESRPKSFSEVMERDMIIHLMNGK
jgi:hypothetical protein